MFSPALNLELDPSDITSHTQGTMRNQIVISLSVFIMLSACAAPQVDQSSANFNETRFASDLNICRGGNFIAASARSIGIAMLGSAYGAIYGAHTGAVNGDTAEGAAIGAALGGAIGLGIGALDALEKHEAEISSCLGEKGYLVAG